MNVRDSRGTPVRVGDVVRFRGKEYTIAAFGPKEGRFGTHLIEFTEEPHTTEKPDEISIDLVGGVTDMADWQKAWPTYTTHPDDMAGKE